MHTETYKYMNLMSNVKNKYKTVTGSERKSAKVNGQVHKYVMRLNGLCDLADADADAHQPPTI